MAKFQNKCPLCNPSQISSLSFCLPPSFPHSLWKKKRKHSSGTTELIPFFQLFWLRAICFNDELILRVHSAALPAWAVMPFAHVRSGPRSNLSLITAGEAKSRNGTSPCSAELHFYHWVPFSLIRCFSPCLSCFAVCLWSFSLSCLILPPPHPLSIVISCTPSPTPPHLFLDLCSSLSAGLLLPPSIRSRRSSGGNSPSAAGSEFRASFIEFAQDSGRACLPIRSWWGASRLWANPQIHPTPACVSKCVCLSLERCQSVSIFEGLSWICSLFSHKFKVLLHIRCF